MTCAPTDRIMQTLRTRVAGATDEMLQLELFNTIDEFLRRTSAWKESIDIDVSSGDTEYPIPLPADSALVRVITATYNGQPVPTTDSSVVQSSMGTLIPEQTFSDGDAMFNPISTDINPPTQIFTYAMYRPTYVSITNAPTTGPVYPFSLVAALTVARQCLDCDCGDWALPEWMFDMYFQDWEDGALGRLFSMPSKPWSNSVLANYHGKRFRNEMAYRKQEVARGFSYDVPIWRFPRAGWP
jgi:hypothetical protein